MAALTLYSYPNNSRACKGVIAAKYGGVQVATPAFDMATSKSKEFLSINPNGKVPALATPEGGIFESNAIAVYLARAGNMSAQLTGATAFAAASIEMWMTWANNELDLPLSAILYQIYNLIPFTQEGTDKAYEDVFKSLAVLQEHLNLRTYLVGERITLADIVVACTLHNAFKMLLDEKTRKKYNNVTRWFDLISHQPHYASTFGPFELCQKTAVADPNGYKPPVVEDKKKGKADAHGAEEDDEPKEEKKVSPLDSLPPSTMDMEAFKKLYSNNDIRKVVCPQFWSGFDAAGFSIHFCDYKYNKELEPAKPFMASNLIGGFFQRAPKNMHKHGFASMLVMGSKETELFIGGVWLFRGTEVPAEMIEDCEDYPHYTWTKVDINDAAQRAKVEDYFAWDGSSLPGPCIDGKNFK